MRACGLRRDRGAGCDMYLSRHSGGTCPFAAGGGRQSVPLSVYNSLSRRGASGLSAAHSRRGINGLMLTGGLELFFLRWRMPYSIHWGARGSLFENIELMLMRDIPVILAVGRISRCSGRRTTCRSTAVSWTERSSKSCTARAHYVVVTGMDEEWLRISSWGQGVLYKPRGIHGLRQEAQPPHTQQHRSHKTQSALILL